MVQRHRMAVNYALFECFHKKVNGKMKNTKNFTSILSVRFLRLRCDKTLIQMSACLHKYNDNIIFNI